MVVLPTPFPPSNSAKTESRPESADENEAAHVTVVSVNVVCFVVVVVAKSPGPPSLIPSMMRD